MISPALNKEYVLPQYDSNNFANIPGLVQYFLTGSPQPKFNGALSSGLDQQYDQVIFLLVDGFGWKFFERYADHSCLKRLADYGHVAKATSQFPSTTTAHISTLCTDQVVGEHGIFEWQYYEPALDAMIVPLLYAYAGEKDRETLRERAPDPQELLPRQSFFQNLRTQGVASYASMHYFHADSSYSEVMTRGADVVPYDTLPVALYHLFRQVERQTTKACHYFYLGDIDGACHTYGPESPQAQIEIEAFLTLFEQIFLRKAESVLQNTLLLVTADHGQIGVSPDTTVFLNLLPEFAQLRPMLKTNRAGEVLTPGGSSRDVFLYIKESSLADAQALLSNRLQDVADVYLTQDLIAAGLFGTTTPSATFMSHVSNLVILPRPGETVWWYDEEKFGMKFCGHHGGLTADEMEIPLILYSLNA